MYNNNYRGRGPGRPYPPNQPYYPPQPQRPYPPNQPYYPPQPTNPADNFPFKIGEKVIHKFTGDELFVIRYGREQLECRKPDLSSGWFYVDELKSASEA